MPFVPQDVLDRLTKLERQVRELTGRANIRPALNQVLNGDVVIGEGGQLLVRSETGVSHLTVGDLSTVYGGTEFGVVIRRRDGSIAMSVWNGQTPDEPQALRLQDAQSNRLLVEDVTAGGLYKPWIPYALPTTDDTTQWPSTTSTSWTTVARSRALLQHPRMRYYLTAVNGGNGQSRVLVDGQTMATSNSGAAAMAGTATVPGYEYDKEVEIELQLRVTSGTDPVRIMPRYLYGVGSAG